MKKIFASVIVIAAFGITAAPAFTPEEDDAGAVALTGCSAITKKNANTALDVVQTACIIANAALSEEKVAEVCDVAHEFIGPMRTLLASSRAAAAARNFAGASSKQEIVCASTNTVVACWPVFADAGAR